MPVNLAERKLRHLLLRAGFGEGTRGKQIRLDRALGTTTPDVIYSHEDEDYCKGVCLYLDGMSAHLHGNPETAARDREIRAWLRGSGYEVLEIPANELDDEDAMAGHFRRLANYLGQPGRGRDLADDRSWFADPASSGKTDDREDAPRLRLVAPTPGSRYRTCVPLVPLRAAAGTFGDPNEPLDEWDHDWVAVETVRQLREGMFVARVTGRSMEPRIPDGSYCLFASPVTGSRQGRTVLVIMRDDVDPETGARFTVKRYRSEKTEDENGWRHARISLEPTSPDFDPIVIEVDDEATVGVVAELVEVIGRAPPEA